MKAFRSAVLWGLLAFSVGFGLFRQVKVAWRSMDAVVSPHEEPGKALRLIRERLSRAYPADLKGSRIAYLTDRKGPRPAGEYFYDAQYAFVPFLLRNSGDSEYQLLDFTSEKALEDHCRREGLTVLFRNGAAALARRKTA